MDSGEEFVAYVGVLAQSPAAKYAGLLEQGGDITPSGHPYLAIPIGDALTPSGVPRYLSPRDVRGGRFVRTRSGKLFYGMPRSYGRGKNRVAGLNIMFLMVRRVRIPAKHWLSRGAAANIGDFIRNVNETLAEKLKPKE